jgi:hypothetical protein
MRVESREVGFLACSQIAKKKEEIFEEGGVLCIDVDYC